MHAAVLSLVFASFALPQWLNAGGFRASETRTWHARSQAVCENNAWMMTGVNLLGQGPLPPEGAQRSAPPPPLKKEQAGPKPPQAQNTPEERREAFLREQERIRAEYEALPEAELLQQLKAANHPQQRHAFDELQWRLRAKAVSDESIEELFRIASLELKDYTWETPTVCTLRLLGELETRRAIETLLDRIDIQIQFVGLWRGFGRAFLMQHPAVDGLLRTGDRAIAPILERARTATDEQWKLMLYVLNVYDHKTPAVRQAMETLLEATEDETAKKRLEEFLATPEPKRPKPEDLPGEPVALRGK